MAKDNPREKEKKVKRTRKGTISGHMYTLAILPVILFALAVIFIGIPFLTRMMYRYSEKELKDACLSTGLLMEAYYPGDYRLTGKDYLYLYKGDTDITMDYSVVDTVSNATGLEISLFYKDTRILTTLTDENGTRMVGTGAASQVYKLVYEDGEEVFYNNTMIFGKPYFTYYMPLTSSHGNIQGIIAAACPVEKVNRDIRNYIIIMIAVAIVLAGLMIAIVLKVTKPMTQSIESIFRFIRESSTGNDTVALDESVLRRHDELGEMGENVLNLQRSMRNMMESDPLTGLFNRRSAQRKIGTVIGKAKSSPESFCISIGDIDFFKHVNDTYGHDAGDDVLVKVADIIREHMRSCGFVARWGGEEFLLVFSNCGIDEAYDALMLIRQALHDKEVEYDGQIHKVTMTFGAAEKIEGIPINHLIRNADDKLYEGKQGGRDRVII